MVFDRKFRLLGTARYWHRGAPGLDYSARHEQALPARHRRPYMKPISSASSRRSRRHFPRMAVTAGILAIVLPLALAVPGGPAPAARASAAANPSCPWLNQSLPISQRVSMLLARMTLADKINMVTGAGFSEPYVFYISAIPSLCVPAIGEEDGPVGVGDGLTGVTQLPAAVSLAATFDPSLASAYGKVIGAEERGKGAMVNL